MNLIAAVDKNWAIGKNNELLVSIPNDMKMFRQMTTGNGQKDTGEFSERTAAQKQSQHCPDKKSELSGQRCHHRAQCRGSAGRAEKI